MTSAETSELLNSEKEQSFDYVSISIAAPETIRQWSKGEVRNPETINYRTFKPEPGGLFCQKIFGPVRDYECACGKYKRIKFKGVVCDRCGVEVTMSRVRRERMGHIELSVPVAHIWFLKSLPSRLGLLLDMTARQLESVIYYEKYLVVDPGKTPLDPKQILTEQEYQQAISEYGDDAFVAKMGAEALGDLLRKMELDEVTKELQEQIQTTRSKQIKKKVARRLKIIQGFIASGNKPEWMILQTLPVIPPDLRPLVPLEGGRFATSDLNDLYRRVINRNNRLRSLLQLKTPDVIINNEKRMLQEAVDALFDNGRHGRPVTGAGNRPLKSLSDMLKGKQGRFRQNLLGKRVDYSGRSVIVIGPELKLHQCGLPKKMALVLFEPFIIRRLKELGFIHTVRGARKMIEKKSPEVWDILEEVTKGHPVLLNRAPTLHRLSIQAFEPVLIEGDAIRLHPLTCTAYNADFDGDQMAVHVPLSSEAIMECKLLMLATNNIFSPSSGKPILTPSQDIVLGSYYLTYEPTAKPEANHRVPIITSVREAQFAEIEGALHFHDWVDYVNPDYGKKTIYGKPDTKLIRTTVGRIIFNTIWPEGMGFANFPVKKGQIGDLILNTYRLVGKEASISVLDALKEMGFKIATRAGISIGIGDMIFPKGKDDIIKKSRVKVDEVENQYKKGIITSIERGNRVTELWTAATDEIAASVFKTLETSATRAGKRKFEGADDPRNQGRWLINPVYVMMDSGARGNKQQVRQLCGARGLMAKPNGDIIERPILSSFRDGLTVLEYFLSTHGARKGLADTALKTADAGYMTRKLCDVAMDVIVTEDDDLNRDGIWKTAHYDGDEEIVKLHERIAGRCASEDVHNPQNPDEVLVKAGDMIGEEVARKIEAVGVERVRIMSPLTHMKVNAIPAKAYGLDPSSGALVKRGTSIGIMAAQSIGEPGTQLTMRTFHVGGVANQVLKTPEIRVRSNGIVHFEGIRSVELKDRSIIVLNKNGIVRIADPDKPTDILEEHSIVIGSVLQHKEGDSIKKGELLARWDPHNVPILAEKAGKVAFKDMISGVTIKREFDATSGRVGTIVIEHKEDLNPAVQILDNGKVVAEHFIPVGAQVSVGENDTIVPGGLIARTPRQATKTQDITGGLPRIAELFEARRPKDTAEMARIEGIVSFEGTIRSKKKLVVTNDEGKHEEHLIPHTKNITVHAGDRVRKGQLLTDGAPDPHEILEIQGATALQDYLITEIQKVYRRQGVTINDKHIEIIIARMLRKVRVLDPGDTDYFWGEQVDKHALIRKNKEIEDSGGKGAEFEPVLLGITKASLETESFISAASFQETTRVLTDASTLARTDQLSGFKENVIMGHLIPAGTGLPAYRRLSINTLFAVTSGKKAKEKDKEAQAD
ncbi:MAG: DNA-directed RNA polymerase subunit beta' [Puniceicoccales bacterium]|jgi:DNA-directed RNA polymerase subunit beta'|nr:DNA-directed RNA polymerase subunit beta' [Puniceicoccales bacterium]